jgi:hypothetical protein
MKWTTEKPLDPGWYWVRSKHWSSMSGTRPCMIIRLSSHTPSGCVHPTLAVIHGPPPFFSLEYDAEWAGPIPPPEEA